MSDLFNGFLDPSVKKFKFSAEGNQYLINFPNNVICTLNRDDFHWTKVFDNQQHSSLMWLHSLGFLPCLLAHDGVKGDGNYVLINKFLSSYADFISGDEGGEFISRMFSADHCVAIRLRVLGILHEKANTDSFALDLDSINKILDFDLKLSADQDFIKYDNHGMMLCVSLILINDYFKNQKNRVVYINKLIYILNVVFDSDGYVKENTIGYHDFYCKFIGNFVDKYLLFRKSIGHALDECDSDLINLRLKADSVRSKVVWQCGGIPPIGDSSEYHTKFPSVSGLHYFPESGFVVFKNDDFYFSLICGSGSEVHKQMDDTSITLRYKGRDIFVDSGLFNFDWEDPNRRYVASQLGHSGFFAKEFDQHLRPIMIRKYGSYKAKIDFCFFNFDMLVISCSVSIPNLLDIKRIVVLNVEKSTLNIFDSIDSMECFSFAQRFVLPSDALIQGGSDRSLEFKFENDIVVNGKFDSSNIFDVVVHDGVRSIKYNEILPSKMIEVASNCKLGNFSSQFNFYYLPK